MTIRLHGLAPESIVDGPGIRLAIFAQGCPHHCPGCHNPASQPMAGGYEGNTDDIVALMDDNPLVDGITLSGGEPFMQPAPCLALARAARDRQLNIWAYTGFTYEELLASTNEDVRALLAQLDVLVDGRFEMAQKSLSLLYCGSSNQRLIDVKESLEQGSVVLWVPPVW